MKDPLTGGDVTVLWVKGSGGDIGSMKLDGFATLYMDKLESLKGLYKSLDQEDAMVHALNHCIFNLNPRAPSIDTCLHGYVPYAHVDHVHSDAVIAIAACEGLGAPDQGDLRRRDGLSALAAPRHRPRHQAWRHGQGAIPNMSAWCWAATASSPGPRRQGPATTRRCASSTRPPSGSSATARSPPSAARRSSACRRRSAARRRRRLMPEIRGRISKHEMKVGHFTDAPEVLEFVNSQAAGAAGAARHLLPRSLPAHQDPPADRAA